MARRLIAVFRQRLLGGFAWNLLVAASTQGSLFVTHLVVARSLGVSEFGRYALLLTTAMAISSIAQSGIGFVAAKYVAELHLTDKRRAGRILSLCRVTALSVGGASAAVLIVGAEALATVAFGHPDMARGLQIIGVAIPFMALNVYQQGALQGFGAFRQSGLAGAGTGLLHVVMAYIGAAHFGLIGVLVALVFSYVVRSVAFAAVLGAVQASHQVVSPPGGFRSDLPLLWSAGLPSAVMGISAAVAFWLVNLLIVRSGGGADAVAHFYAANQIRLLALQAPTILTGVSVALLNRMRGEGNRHGYRTAFAAYWSANMSMAIVLAGLAAVFAGPLMSIYGADFSAHQRLLQLMVLSIVPEVAAIALYVHVQAHERLWSSLLMAWLPKDILFVSVTFAFATAGVAAAAVSYALAWAFAAIMLAVMAVRTGFGPKRHTISA